MVYFKLVVSSFSSRFIENIDTFGNILMKEMFENEMQKNNNVDFTLNILCSKAHFVRWI